MIEYVYWKSPQSISFGSCPEWYWPTKSSNLSLRGYKWEIEASTPELRAEQLQRIRATPPTQGNKQ